MCDISYTSDDFQDPTIDVDAMSEELAKSRASIEANAQPVRINSFCNILNMRTGRVNKPSWNGRIGIIKPG